MTTFIVLAQRDGGIKMTDYQRATWRDTIKKNADRRIRIKIDPVVPESRKQRAFYHGAILPLWAYLDGNDYKSSSLLESYHEVAKREFNPMALMIGGKKKIVGKTTKGDLNSGFLERIVEYLEENYGIDPGKVLDTELYKKFRDRINIMNDYDTFIDYLREIKILK